MNMKLTKISKIMTSHFLSIMGLSRSFKGTFLSAPGTSRAAVVPESLSWLQLDDVWFRSTQGNLLPATTWKRMRSCFRARHEIDVASMKSSHIIPMFYSRPLRLLEKNMSPPSFVDTHCWKIPNSLHVFFKIRPENNFIYSFAFSRVFFTCLFVWR